mgnify:CR=1 FL=1
MTISNIFSSVMQYVSEDVMRIFSPSDDNYPVIGVQSFTGELYKRRNSNAW